MKAVAIFLSILAFAACLVIGIQAGYISGHPSASTATDTPNPFISPSQQRNILLILVDDLGASRPSLNAAWLALYRPDLPKVTFLPLYPASPSLAGTEVPDLAASFSLAKNLSPSTSFLKALGVYKVEWNGYLLADRYGLSQSIDWMEGIDMDGSRISGQTALGTLLHPAGNSTGAADNQKHLLNAICQRTSQLPLEANWVGLAKSLQGKHINTDLGIDTLVSDWKAMMSASTPFACSILIP